MKLLDLISSSVRSYHNLDLLNWRNLLSVRSGIPPFYHLAALDSRKGEGIRKQCNSCKQSRQFRSQTGSLLFKSWQMCELAASATFDTSYETLKMFLCTNIQRTDKQRPQKRLLSNCCMGVALNCESCNADLPNEPDFIQVTAEMSNTLQNEDVCKQSS